MRILAVRGHNLTSLAGTFAVDLNNGPLRRAGLFAITGPTGAGKSTILDALCLALFDAIPRLPTGRGEQSAAERDPKTLAANDVRGVLRRGAASGWAEVDFIGVDGHGYRARWEVRRARLKADGAVQAQSMSLSSLDGDQRFGDGKKSVLAEIEQRLGLSFEQFRRAVLLAQGDFATFLKAPATERSALLELLTGTEIYSALSKAAHERERREKQALDNLVAQGGGIGVLAAEARAELETERQRADAAVADADRLVEKARAALDWWTQDRRLAEAEQTAQDASAHADAAWQRAEPRRAVAALRRRAQPLRPLIADADRLAQAVAQARHAEEDATAARAAAQQALAAATDRLTVAASQAEAANAARLRAEPALAQAAELDGRIAALAREAEEAQTHATDAEAQARAAAEAFRRADAALTAGRERVTALTAALAAQDALAPLAGQWARWDAALLRVADADTRRRAAEAEAQRLATALAALDDQAESAQAAVAAAQADLDAAGRALAGVEAEPAPALDAVLTQRRATLDRRDRLRGLAALAEQTAQRRAEAARWRAERAARREEDARETAAAAACAAEANAKQAARDEADDTLRRLRLIQREDVDSLRRRLVAGEACPVCGSDHHPWAGDGAPLAQLRDVTRDQEQRVAALARDHTDALARQAGHEATARAARSAVAGLDERLDVLDRALDTDGARWTRERSALVALLTGPEVPTPPLPMPLTADALPATPEAGALAEWLAEFDTRLEALAEEEARTLDHRKRLDAAREAQTQAGDRLRRAGEAQSRVAREREATGNAQRLADGNRDHARRDGDTARSELAEPLAFLPDWRAALDRDPAAFRAEWSVRVAAYQNQRDERADQERGVADSERRAERAQADHSGAAALAETARQRCHGLTDRLDALRTERAGLLDGQPVAERRAALDAQQRQTDSAAQQAALERQDAAARLTAAAHLVERSHAAAIAADQAAVEARDRLTDALTASGLSDAEARHATAQPEAEGLAEDHALAELETARRDAALVLAERRRQRADHRDRQPPHAARSTEDGEGEVDTSGLTGAEAALTDAINHQDAARQRQGAARGRLTADDENRARLADLTIAIDAQKSQHALWASLSGLIGSADGQKMRNFAQSLSLDRLLAHANRHLDELARRYRLERVPGANLDIQVIDREMGDERRGVHSLSGGELFLVSLALALGLSAMAAGSAGGIGTLFIDEGFGTLDPDSLDVALSCLEALQAGGRQVGVISHVPAMVERIGAQVRVSPLGGGRSRVTVLASGLEVETNAET
ncbi:AAA family ATPase [Azospirillum griseum]|uniref:Exonuclease n=1 Tax=Azospirillum griseum TaxID=2496639 RepID=A0A3S0K362_9PROT|nr:AAA family ATPase [Azospirillum griseum]RTR18396.1 exonuclease [Azospirillum griseum]